MIKRITTYIFLLCGLFAKSQNCDELIGKNQDKFTKITAIGSISLELQNENSYTKRKLKFNLSKIDGNEHIYIDISTTTGNDESNIKIFPDAGVYFLFDDDTSILVDSKDYPANESGYMQLFFSSVINSYAFKKLKTNNVVAVRLVRTGWASEQMALDFDIPNNKQSFFKDVINCMEK